MSNQEHSIAEGPDAQLMGLVIVRKDSALKAAFEWKQHGLTEQQKYQVAKAVDEVMRVKSKRWSAVIEELDEAALIGQAVSRMPRPIRKMIERQVGKRA